MFKSIMRGMRGFTLIELLAVMAIVAVLAGIVSVAVAGSGGTSRDTQVAEDANSSGSAMADFFNLAPFTEGFKHQDATLLDNTTVQQETSTPWPEVFITPNYATVFVTGSATRTVASFTFLDTDNTNTLTVTPVGTSTAVDVTEATLLENFAALDWTNLEVLNFTTTIPESVTSTSDTPLTSGSTVNYNTYLWLLEKDTASGSGGAAVSSRNVVILGLTKVEETDTTDKFDLTYRKVN